MDSESNAKAADAGVALAADDFWWLFWLAVYFVICLIFWRRAVKQEKGMPPTVYQHDDFGWWRGGDWVCWRPGDVLASAGDWWRWQIYVCLAYMLSYMLSIVVLWGEFAEIPVAVITGDTIFLVFASIFGFGVFVYFSIQRFMAAKKRLPGLSLLVMVIIGTLLDAAGYASIHLTEIAIITVKIYIGTLRNAEPRAELTGDNRTAA